MASPPTVPVTVDVSLAEVVQGLFEIGGLLSYRDRAVVFEYQTRGLPWQPSEVTTVRMPLDELQEVELRRRMVDAAIVVRPRRLAALKDVPGARQGEVVFKVKMENRDRATDYVSHVRLMLTGADLGAQTSIPFKLPDVGMREISGEVYVEDETFLVFAVEDALIGEFDRERQVIKVELRALDDLYLERGTFSDRLCIRPKKRDLLQVMPGKHERELKLKLRKKYRDEAARLVDGVKWLQAKAQEE